MSLILILLLVVLTIPSCYGIIQTNVSTTASGKVNLECTFQDLSNDDYWIAIYRTNLAYAECLFWDRASVIKPPYSCTGNFTVSIVESKSDTWVYTVTIDEESSAVDANDYFCRILRKGNNTYEQVEQGIHSVKLDTTKFPKCSSNPRNLSFVDGDKFTLTCSPLGIIPVRIQWSRSDGVAVTTGYSDTFDLDRPEKDAEVLGGYIYFHTELPIQLNRLHDGVTFTCTVTSHTEKTNSPPDTTNEIRTCSIGPFKWQNTTLSDEDEPDEGLILGLEMWFFSFIVAASVFGLSVLLNIALIACLIRRVHYEKYNVRRKQSQKPIVPEIELENNHQQSKDTQFYDAVDPGQELAYPNNTYNTQFDDDFDDFDEDVYPSPEPMYDNQ